MDETLLQQIIEEEKSYGVDYKAIEEQYHFDFVKDNGVGMELEETPNQPQADSSVTNEFTPSNKGSNDKIDAIYISTRYITPSQLHGISLQDESRIRAFASELFYEAGYSLRLPWYTIITAQAVFHRFYYRVSFLDHDLKDSIMACLVLATKIEESQRKIRDVITVFNHILKIREGVEQISVLNPSSDYYHYLKQLVIESERYVLKELGFELYRLTEHPHSYLLDYLKRLKSSKEVAKKAWNYLNDSYRTTLCIHYPPHIIAASCLYLAIRSTGTPMPKTTWWAIFDTSIKHILEICGEILYLYEQPPMTMEDVKKILDAGFQANNMQREYFPRLEDAYSMEKKIEEETEKKAEKEKEKERTRRRDSPARRSPRHSNYRRDDYKGRRRDSRDRRDRSPRRGKRRSPSRDRRKYSRSSSYDRDDKGRKRDKSTKKKDKHSSEERSPSEDRKKKKREKSREKRRDKDKEKERDRNRDERSHNKHKKEDREKDKHRDRESDKKRHRDKDSKEERSPEKRKSHEKKDMEIEEKSKQERKSSFDKAIVQEVVVQKETKVIEEEVAKAPLQKEEKKVIPILPESLEALKQQILRQSSLQNGSIGKENQTQDNKALNVKSDDNKIVEEKPPVESDEDDEKLLELKRKILEKKKAKK